MANIKPILKENKLELIETEFFRGKKNVARVKDGQGNRFILKTGRIEPFQVELYEAAKLIRDQLAFKVPVIIKRDKGWILFEEIEGKFLFDFYNEKPDWCVKVSKKISDSYQLLIQEIQKKKSLSNLLSNGQKWHLSRFDLWSQPIVETGLIETSLVEELKREFNKVVEEKGENFFKWSHGNIIGDHIIVSDGNQYLIDLAAVPRAGRGYYDFLRALDFMFLKAENEERMFTSIPKWMKQYLAEFDENEIKLIFAFRCIGILGWDILHHKVKYTAGDLKKKKQLLVKFIKRKY